MIRPIFTFHNFDATPKDMFKRIQQISAIIVLLISMCIPATAFAEWPGCSFLLEFGAGIEDLRVNNKNYDADNLGANFAIDAGFQIYMFAIMLSQEFGYIDMNPPEALIQPNESKRDRSFKGATLLLTRLSFPFFLKSYLDDDYERIFISGPMLELGFGGEYMKRPIYPSGSNKYDKWFALRLGAGYEFFFRLNKASSLKLSLVFEYTLGVSDDHNSFDNQNISHLLMGKLRIGYHNRLRLF